MTRQTRGPSRQPVIRLYQPETGDEAAGPVQTVAVELLTPEPILWASIDLTTLSGYVAALKAAARAQLCAPPHSFQLLIKATLHPDAPPTIEIATDRPVSDDLLQALYERLVDLAAPRTQREPVGFGIILSVTRRAA